MPLEIGINAITDNFMQAFQHTSLHDSVISKPQPVY